MLLAQSADISHSADHSHERQASLAKRVVELDRSAAMREAGYRACLTQLLRPGLHQFKSDLLVGAPREKACFGWMDAWDRCA